MGVARDRQSAVGGSRGLMGKRPSADLVGGGGGGGGEGGWWGGGGGGGGGLSPLMRGLFVMLAESVSWCHIISRPYKPGQ